MIWNDIELIKKEQTGLDELDNPIYEEVSVGVYKARYASVTKEDVDMDNRLADVNVFKLLVKTTDICDDCEKIKINGTSYNIMLTKRLGVRFISLFMTRYG